MRRRIASAVVLLALVVGAQAPAAGAADAGAAARAKPGRGLKAFASCSSLVAYGRHYAHDRAVAVGVPPRAIPQTVTPLAEQLGASPTTEAGKAVPMAAPMPADSAGEAFSNTNVQEQGVDEPDLVKTDGRHAYLVAGGRVLAYDLAGDTPALVGSITVGGTPQELLLRGKRLLVIGAARSASPEPVADDPARAIAMPYYLPSAVQLTELNVEKPAAISVARTLTVDGQYVSGRLTGGSARIVLNTPPALGVAEPRPLDAFVPETTIVSNISKRTFKRRLVPCDDVRRPGSYSGLDLLTVMTIDLDRGLYSVDRDAVIAGAQVVYASQTGLYVASQRYVPSLDSPQDVPSRMTTEIHRFDTSKADRTTYRSSGSVPGFVLNQFALSEHEQALRVATTEEPLWFGGAQQRDSESGVSVLREQGSKLVTVGRVGGLGKGERIYAARFIGDTGYLVTFRQVDPLYTLDLSDPRAPKAVGELKIAGYSAYLHPVGEGLLLGVGQDATEAGIRKGPQISLFDVTDPAAPKRLHQRLLGDQGASTEAEWDHHAFLWWAPEHLAVLPLMQHASDSTIGPVPAPLPAVRARAAAAAPFAGAIGLRVERSGISEAGRASHGTAPYPVVVRRSLVARGRLVTVSDRGIAAHRLSDLSTLGFAAFPKS